MSSRPSVRSSQRLTAANKDVATSGSGRTTRSSQKEEQQAAARKNESIEEGDDDDQPTTTGRRGQTTSRKQPAAAVGRSGQQRSGRAQKHAEPDSEEEDSDDSEDDKEQDDQAVATRGGRTSARIATKGKAAARKGQGGAQAKGRKAAPQPESESDEEAEEDEEEEEDEQQGDGDGEDDEGAGPSAGLRACGKRTLMEVLEGRLGDDRLRKVLRAELANHTKHANAKQGLLNEYRQQYSEWNVYLREQFSLLFYGLGSKHRVLDSFARECLAKDRSAAVKLVDGFNPKCTVRDIVVDTFESLSGRKPYNKDVRALIEEIREEPLDRHIYIVIHNIEGPGLRRDIGLLSQLAACPQVHLVASTDHVMAAKLWDSAACGLFKWRAINITTFQPYLRELAEVPGVLGGLNEAATKRSAGTTLRSLVVGAQEVFRVLAEHQIEEATAEPGWAGVSFQLLYRMCRERFLVPNEAALRQHLVEFTDHQLVLTRAEGNSEVLYIPLETEAIQAVLRDLDEARDG